MTADEADRFVRLFVDAWARPDSGGFAALWLDEGTFVHPSVAGTLRGADVPRWSEAVKAALPDLRFFADAWAAHGDVLMLEWTTTATIGGTPLRWSGVDRFRLRDGKIAAETVYYDTLPIWSALEPSMARAPLVRLDPS